MFEVQWSTGDVTWVPHIELADSAVLDEYFEAMGVTRLADLSSEPRRPSVEVSRVVESHRAEESGSTIANCVLVCPITFELLPGDKKRLVSTYKEQPSWTCPPSQKTTPMPPPYYQYPTCWGGYNRPGPITAPRRLPNFNESADICPELVMSKGAFSTMLNHQFQLINMLTKGTERTLQGAFAPPRPAQNGRGSYQKTVPNHGRPVTTSTTTGSLHDRLSSPPTTSLEATNRHAPTAPRGMARGCGHHRNQN